MSPFTLELTRKFYRSKLRWVKENEPELYGKIHAFMLPGDYIAMRLTGEAATTLSGLSEGILWDFSSGSIASFLLHEYGIDADLIPPLTPTFGEQGRLERTAAQGTWLTGRYSRHISCRRPAPTMRSR